MTTAQTKQAANKAAATAQHAALLATIQLQLAALQAASARRFDAPADVNFCHVGDLAYMAKVLGDLIDRTGNLGEYAR